MTKKIDIQTVEHIAKLAHLNLSDQEKEDFVNKLGDILFYMEKLNEIDTEGIPETYHSIEISNVFRDDIDTGQGISREKALENAPSHGDGYFKVPKIIDN